MFYITFIIMIKVGSVGQIIIIQSEIIFGSYDSVVDG